MNNNKVFGWFAAIALGASCCLLLANRPASSAQGVVIPSSLKDRTCRTYLVSAAELRATVHADTDGGSVAIRWQYDALGKFSPPQASMQQLVAVGYKPTTMEVVDGTHLLVSGKGPFGRTKVELWKLTAPSYSAGSGLKGGSIDKVDVLYDDKVVGFDMVNMMLLNAGKSSAAFVQTHDTKDLYELTWSTSPATFALLMSPIAGTSVIHQPALNQRRTTYWRGDHVAHGYVYVFENEDALGAEPALLLTDTDRDGVLDGNQTVGIADGAWRNMGLADATNYVSLKGKLP